MTIKGCWVELCQYKYFVDPAVDAVAHWNVYKPVASTNRNLKNVNNTMYHYRMKQFSNFESTKTMVWLTHSWCSSSFGKRKKLNTRTSSQYDGNNIFRVGFSSQKRRNLKCLKLSHINTNPRIIYQIMT